MVGAENHEMRCESKPTKCEKLMRYRDEWGGIIPSRPVAVRVIRCRHVMDGFDASKKVLTMNQPQGVDQKESMGDQMQISIESLSVENTKQIVIAWQTKAAKLVRIPILLEECWLVIIGALGASNVTGKRARGQEQRETLTKSPHANPLRLGIDVKASFDGKIEGNDAEVAERSGYVGQNANFDEWRRGHSLRGAGSVKTKAGRH
jgi:hypothetical protein